ncbi:Rap1a/Tai family immunity protein [Pseudomonas putida]|uniref:Rap1a immunity protein domain-containing protein n=1 Tax=Pseudomonas putida TaxID=303 RepID=A0A1L5PJ75_PSEPU|nr:Rap1a/Tai family immunity protein [Pseudomonas putida]APO80192.1 hypothetical protein BL240_01255 [Pseudomonas putida]
MSFAFYAGWIMRLQAVVCIGLVGLIAGAQAHAKEEVGLLAQCKGVVQHLDNPRIEDRVTVSDGLCVGMIEGVLKTMFVLNSKLPKEFQTCFPRREIPVAEAVRVVVAYLKESEMTEIDDATQAMFAIQEAYPC